MPRALSVGLGGAGAHLALPVLLWGAGEGQPAAPGTLPAAGRLRGKFSSSANRGLTQKCRQPLQGHVCRGVQCPFAELEGSKWLLQGACHLGVFSRLFGESAPTVPHTCLCNSETLLDFLESRGEHVHVDVDPVGAEWGRGGA